MCRPTKVQNIWFTSGVLMHNSVTEMFSLMLRFQPMTAQLAIGCVYFYAVLIVYWLLILVFWPMSSMFSDLRPWFYASQLDLGIELSWCWVHHLKVSKFRKQIVLYSFEPKTKRNISALRFKWGQVHMLSKFIDL